MRAIASLAVILSACVGPARDPGTYEEKAVRSAEAVASASRTALYATRGAAAGRLLPPYTSVVVFEAEEDAAAAEEKFAAVQPPDARSDAVRAELLPVIQEAVNAISELRIAVRRERFDEISHLAPPLADASQRLTSFTERHR